MCKLIRKQQMLLFLYCATNSVPSSGISKILCTSEVASATCTYVKLSDILQLGTNFLWFVVMDRWLQEGFFINEQIFLIIAYELSSSLLCFFFVYLQIYQIAFQIFAYFIFYFIDYSFIYFTQDPYHVDSSFYN